MFENSERQLFGQISIAADGLRGWHLFDQGLRTEVDNWSFLPLVAIFRNF